ncbi:MAG: GIY-YIG nuclease family protein [Patescibacteria group bacterium]
MFHYVYVLKSMTYDQLYIGYTTDLRRRVQEHNRGETFSTKRYIPWKLIYYEACLDELDAKRRERYLKTNQGRRLLRRRLKEYMYKTKKF